MARDELPRLAVHCPCVRDTVLTAVASRIGTDLLVSLSGGHEPHIGTVVLAEPCRRLHDPTHESVTVSVLNRAGHRDEVLARAMATTMCAHCGQAVVVTAGIHIHQADAAEISAITTAGRSLGNQLLQAMEDAGWHQSI